jgi:Rrf2 family protein
MLNKKTQYALQALMFLAEQKNYEPMLIAVIAEKKQIPLKFLENILLHLKKEGILESKKGKKGGYFLSMPPSSIPISKIIRILQGPIAMLPCVSLYFYERCQNCDEKKCGLHDTMILVRDATLKLLDNKTIADIAMLQPFSTNIQEN